MTQSGNSTRGLDVKEGGGKHEGVEKGAREPRGDLAAARGRGLALPHGAPAVRDRELSQPQKREEARAVDHEGQTMEERQDCQRACE